MFQDVLKTQKHKSERTLRNLVRKTLVASMPYSNTGHHGTVRRLLMPVLVLCFVFYYVVNRSEWLLCMEPIGLIKRRKLHLQVGNISMKFHGSPLAYLWSLCCFYDSYSTSSSCCLRYSFDALSLSLSELHTTVTIWCSFHCRQSHVFAWNVNPVRRPTDAYPTSCHKPISLLCFKWKFHALPQWFLISS